VTTRTWPADWDSRKAGVDCPMCAEGRPEVNDDGTRVFRGAYSDAYLRRLAAPRGYVIVVWRGRHVSEPTDLTTAEAAAYWLEVLDVARGIERRYKPAKLNIQILGNAVPHLHTHVVPRYVDDPTPGRPPTFLDDSTAELSSSEYDREAAALRQAIQAAARTSPV
jgi:diadenosine tetraphosphate (Ap4A) HIT family hydrolase